MTVWNMHIGNSATIESIDHCSDLFTKRLSELGLFKGAKLTCVKALPFHGPKVYQLSDSIFSLDQELASKIKISSSS